MAGENLEIHGACAVSNATGTPAYTFNSGIFTGTIVDNGVGDYQLALNANDGFLAAECSCILTNRTVPHAPRQCHHALVHTSPTSKQVLSTEEAAAGAASIAADLDFDLVVVKRKFV